MLSDKRIVKRVLDGHKDDYRILVDRYRDQVFKVALSTLGSHDAALDASQEAFIRAYEKLGTYKGGEFGGWLRRIVVNISLRRISREIPCDTVEELADLPCEDWNPVETEVIQRADLAERRKQFYQLPAKYRVVLALRYQEELTYREISEILAEPVSTVRMWLHYAKRLLAKQLKGDYDDAL